MTMNCIIIDDEPLAIEVIAEHCKHFSGLNIVQTCSSAMEAFAALHQHAVDLIFLDINMPVVNGLSFLRSLKDPPAVILTTAQPDYALESYELNVVDYLLKPIALERFQAALQKFFERKGAQSVVISSSNAATAVQPNFNVNTNTKDFIFIKENGKLVKLNFRDIIFVEGMKDYLKIVTTSKVHIVHQTMKSMEESLPATAFMRVHKSYIIALAAIKQIDGNCIETEKGGVPLSASYKDDLMHLLKL